MWGGARGGRSADDADCDGRHFVARFVLWRVWTGGMAGHGRYAPNSSQFLNDVFDVKSKHKCWCPSDARFADDADGR